MAIKSKELAKILGVSAATVSLVLNDKPGICEETRRQLIDRINKLGYGYMLTNGAGSGGVHMAEKNIVYMVFRDRQSGEKQEQHCYKAVSGAEAEARKNDYNMVIAHVEEEGKLNPLNCIDREKTAGIIVQKPCLSDNDAERLDRIGIPYVVLDTYDVDADVNSVSVNNRRGIYSAISYLYEMGHRHIGFITDDSCSRCREVRLGAYYAAMRRLGLDTHESYCISVGSSVRTDSDIIESFSAIQQNMLHIPTAVTADSDVTALKFIRAIQSIGYRVPDDISVIGFDDTDICSMIEPGLTTVKVPFEILGREAAGLLISEIKRYSEGTVDSVQNPNKIKIEINASLALRESVLNIGFKY